MIVMTRVLNSFTRIEKAILLCCFAALFYFAGGFFGMQKSTATLPPVFEEAPAVKSALLKTPNSSALISVYVAGAVRKAGVLRLPENARVQDALKLAGGASKNADLNSINLAGKLKDGEQVLVLQRGAAIATKRSAATQGRSTSSAKLPLRPVNVNMASAGELETLPGIGPATSSRILERRAKNRFRSLDDLDEVKGLGPKKLEKLKPFVVF